MRLCSRRSYLPTMLNGMPEDTFEKRDVRLSPRVVYVYVGRNAQQFGGGVT